MRENRLKWFGSAEKRNNDDIDNKYKVEIILE